MSSFAALPNLDQFIKGLLQQLIIALPQSWEIGKDGCEKAALRFPNF